MNPVNIVIVGIVALLLTTAIISLIKNRKKGGCAGCAGCSCGCGHRHQIPAGEKGSSEFSPLDQLNKHYTTHDNSATT